jgi:hypothetical protein
VKKDYLSSWQQPKEGKVSIIIYDLVGKEIKTIVDEVMSSGMHHIEFSAGLLPSGIYFYKITVGNYFQTRKMMLLK